MVRILTGLLMVLTVLTGCADQEPQPSTEPAGAPPSARDETPTAGKEDGRDSDPEPPPAVPRKVIGGVGESSTGCELPARFMMTAQWNARSVRAMAAVERADLGLVCEVYSPSQSGLLRVWIGDEHGSDPRRALRAFLEEAADRGVRPGGSRPPDAARPRYATLVAGGGNGWQVTYPHPADDGGAAARMAAFALPLDDGVMVVSMGPMPPERYERVLPIYVLAKTTIVVVDPEQETRGTR